MIEEHWLDRAVEDKLGQVIDKYRSQGKDVHNVAALRSRVASDINALRGTPQWSALVNRYDPKPVNRIAWCCVCDKPVNRGSVSAWLEDRVGNVFCSQECKNNTDRHPISLDEYKRRVKERGSMTTHRKEIVDGEVVEGDQITFTWDQVKDWGGPYIEPAEPVAVSGDAAADEIEWTDD